MVREIPVVRVPAFEPSALLGAAQCRWRRYGVLWGGYLEWNCTLVSCHLSFLVGAKFFCNMVGLFWSFSCQVEEQEPENAWKIS